MDEETYLKLQYEQGCSIVKTFIDTRYKILQFIGIYNGAILTIAVADSLSDALGIHMSEEAEAEHSHKTIWRTTYATAFFKFIFALLFIIPILLLSLQQAVIASIIAGLILIILLSYYLAKLNKIKPIKAIMEHIVIAILVIVITYYLGIWIANVFV